MHVHSVYFWLEEDLDDDQRKRFVDGLRALKGINFVRDSFIGTPADTDRDVVDNSYDYTLMLYFDDTEDQNAYQEHPIHQEFVEDCEAFWEEVVVYDSVDEE